jgi:hypothetical protein
VSARSFPNPSGEVPGAEVVPRAEDPRKGKGAGAPASGGRVDRPSDSEANGRGAGTPCPGPSYMHDRCRICRGTELVSAKRMEQLVAVPFPAIVDDVGKEIYPAGVEWRLRRARSKEA